MLRSPDEDAQQFRVWQFSLPCPDLLKMRSGPGGSVAGGLQ
jgi:hypothetical protein